MNASSPNQNAEFVNCSISQPWATACIQVPTLERNAPVQKRRKLRCDSARNIPGRRPGTFAVASNCSTSVLMTEFLTFKVLKLQVRSQITELEAVATRCWIQLSGQVSCSSRKEDRR